MPGADQKTCVACGRSCAGQARTKDSRGRYYHQVCYERAKAAHKRASNPSDRAVADAFATAESPPVSNDKDILAMLLEEQSAAAPPTQPTAVAAGAMQCPGCGARVAPGSVLCVTCGHQFQAGGGLKTRVSKPPRAASSAGAIKKYVLFGLAGVFVLLALASFIAPPIALLHLGVLILVCVAWSLYFYISAFVESFSTGLKVIFVPFYQWVYMGRSTDLFVRRGFWVVALGAITFIPTVAYHVSHAEDWAYDEKEMLEARDLYGRGAGKEPKYIFPGSDYGRELPDPDTIELTESDAVD